MGRRYHKFSIAENFNNSFISISDEVKDIMQDLKTIKSTGPNNLPNKVIKHVKVVLSTF